MVFARSLKDQLLAHKRVTPTGCWEWTGWINKEGYGRIQWKGKKYLTHIAAAMAFKGYDPATYFTLGLQVNHLCHNRKCFNPSHFYIGTQEENMEDLAKKNAGIDLLPPESPEIPPLPEDEQAALDLLRARGYAIAAVHPDEIVEGVDLQALEDWMYEASDEFQDLDTPEDAEEEEEESDKPYESIL